MSEKPLETQAVEEVIYVQGRGIIVVYGGTPTLMADKVGTVLVLNGATLRVAKGATIKKCEVLGGGAIATDE